MTSFRISEDDYLHSQILFGRIPTWRKVVIAMGALALLLLALFTPSDIAVPAGAALAFGAASFVVARLVIAPRAARKNYRLHKDIQAEMHVELISEGLRLATADANSLLRWENIFKWRLDDRLLLIYHSPRLYNILPWALARDGFDMHALIRLLEAKLGPAT